MRLPAITPGDWLASPETGRVKVDLNESQFAVVAMVFARPLAVPLAVAERDANLKAVAALPQLLAALAAVVDRAQSVVGVEMMRRVLLQCEEALRVAGAQVDA